MQLWRLAVAGRSADVARPGSGGVAGEFLLDARDVHFHVGQDARRAREPWSRPRTNRRCSMPTVTALRSSARPCPWCAAPSIAQRAAADSGATVAGVPRQHPAGGDADVGAVQVGPDAFGEVGDRGFAQAGIRAGRTRLGAFDVRLDAPGEGAPVDPAEVGWVGASSIADAVLAMIASLARRWT